MRIAAESQMRIAASEEIDAYQPTFRGESLEIEASLPEVSLRNLRVLLKAGLRVVSLVAVENDNILVVFETGETYLATGFAMGEASDLTKHFAIFLAEAFPRQKRQDLEFFIVNFYNPGHRGVIDLTMMPGGGPKIHKPE